MANPLKLLSHFEMELMTNSKYDLKDCSCDMGSPVSRACSFPAYSASTVEGSLLCSPLVSPLPFPISLFTFSATLFAFHIEEELEVKAIKGEIEKDHLL